MVASREPPTGDLACNPGTCPDWDLNQQPFGSQVSAQSTEPHQPGLIFLYYFQTEIDISSLRSNSNLLVLFFPTENSKIEEKIIKLFLSFNFGSHPIVELERTSKNNCSAASHFSNEGSMSHRLSASYPRSQPVDGGG